MKMKIDNEITGICEIMMDFADECTSPSGVCEIDDDVYLTCFTSKRLITKQN